jgi:hypothetical protein
MLIFISALMFITMLILIRMLMGSGRHVKIVPAPPRPPRVEWWRHTEQGKKLNWKRRGSPIDLHKVMCFQNLKKQVGTEKLSNTKEHQLKQHINPHKEEWQTPETECHVTGRRVSGVKRLRWEAEPVCGAEPKRGCYP